MERSGIDLALVHYPVVNKNGDVIGSAVTNLDLHDIARSVRTFGGDTLYVVTPYKDQQQLVREILDHWLIGHGAVYNAKRKEALATVCVCADLAELYRLVTAKRQKRPVVLTTCARRQANTRSYQQVRQGLLAGASYLIQFGTAWGLAPEIMAAADATLPPIRGLGDYNHLSVRAAAAIVLDRLLGERE